MVISIMSSASPPDPHQGSAPKPRWGTSVPRLPVLSPSEANFWLRPWLYMVVTDGWSGSYDVIVASESYRLPACLASGPFSSRWRGSRKLIPKPVYSENITDSWGDRYASSVPRGIITFGVWRLCLRLAGQRFRVNQHNKITQNSRVLGLVGKSLTIFFEFS